MMCHNSLSNYYMVNHMLKDEFNYSLSELENLLPFERDLYIDLHIARIEEKRKINQHGSESG